jgi:hypothetical protein
VTWCLLCKFGLPSLASKHGPTYSTSRTPLPNIYIYAYKICAVRTRRPTCRCRRERDPDPVCAACPHSDVVDDAVSPAAYRVVQGVSIGPNIFWDAIQWDSQPCLNQHTHSPSNPWLYFPSLWPRQGDKWQDATQAISKRYFEIIYSMCKPALLVHEANNMPPGLLEYTILIPIYKDNVSRENWTTCVNLETFNLDYMILIQGSTRESVRGDLQKCD